MVRTAKRPTPKRTYDIALTGELEGFHVTMGAMSGREIIAIQRGLMTEADVLDMIAMRCLANDLEVEDIRDLDYWIIAEILEAWSNAMKEVSLPPTNGTS